MSIGCTDICSDIDARLRQLGFEYPDDEDHDPLMAALNQCSLERDDFLRELRDALDAAMTELETLGRTHGWDNRTAPCWPKCAAAIAKTEGKAWLQKPEEDYLRVEYLVAWEDGTWTTTTHTVPGTDDDTDRLTRWANDNLAPLPAYRKSILFAVYAVPAEEG